MDQDTINQHYVQQFYLKQFSSDGKTLRAYDMRNHKILPKRYSISSICSGDFFYAQQTGKYDDVSQEIEVSFKLIEDLFADSYESICEEIRGTNAISENTLRVLSLYMSLSHLRTLHQRESIHRTAEDAFKQVGRIIAADKEQFYRLTEQAHKRALEDEEKEGARQMLLNANYNVEMDNTYHLRMLEQVPGIASIFFHKVWRIYIADFIDGIFLTSDTPVIEVFPEQKGFYGAHIFERTHYFPLSPNILIEISEMYDGQTKKVKRQRLKDNHDLDEFNRLRFAWSHRYVYSDQETDFRYGKYIKDLRNIYTETYIKTSMR